jgi:hypothetical protein
MNTEDEARGKRCCGGAGCGAKKMKGASNRATIENWGGRQVERYCIASACMAWRTVADSENKDGISGYCGLAGK